MEELKDLTVYDHLKLLSRKQRKQINDLEKTNIELQKHIKVLLNKMHEVSNVLGACKDCWGENQHCKGCAGKGRPGWTRPDKVYLRKILNDGKTWWHKLNGIKLTESCKG